MKGSPAEPEPYLCFAVKRLVRQMIQRSDDGGPPGIRSATSSPVRRRARDPPVVRRHASSVGVRAGLASRAVLSDPDTVYAGVEDAALFRSTDGGRAGSELAGSRSRHGAELAARRRRDVPAHHHPRARATPDVSSSPSPRRGCSAATTPARRGGLSTSGLRSDGILTTTPRSATACTTSRCTVATRSALHAKALGRDAQRRRRRVLDGGQR